MSIIIICEAVLVSGAAGVSLRATFIKINTLYAIGFRSLKIEDQEQEM